MNLLVQVKFFCLLYVGVPTIVVCVGWVGGCWRGGCYRGGVDFGTGP